AKAAEGLSAQRIYQDLAAEGAPISYDSVRRYLRRLGHVRPLPFRRMECAAGEEAQVDFGTGAPIVGADGKRQKSTSFASCSVTVARVIAKRRFGRRPTTS